MASPVVLECTKQKESKKLSGGFSFAMTDELLPCRDFIYCAPNVDAIAESEGFGSSCRVDAEITASEDSCGPKGKSMSLNMDRHDSFNVPQQVLSISKLSRSERKSLEVRLKSELEQVLVLQKKLVSVTPNGAQVPSSSAIQSCSDGQKIWATENFHKTSKFMSDQGKKQGTVVQNGPSLKRGPLDKFESVKHAGPISKKDAMLMKQCETLLKRMMSHKFGWVFNSPVDVVKLKIPDYFSIIKNPMDLGTIKSKIAKHIYQSPLDFAADVRLTFSNAMTYNPPGHDVHIMADNLNKFFEVRWKSIEKRLPVTDAKLAHAKLGVSREMPVMEPVLELKKRKEHSSVNPELNMDIKKKAKTEVDKLSLSRDIESFQGDIPEHIINFLRRHSCDANGSNDGEIEVDIDALSDDTLRKLRTLLDDYLQEKHSNQHLNESGLSNSLMQPCKDIELVAEDVDTRASDPPISSHPPDTSLRNNKRSSLSSSSGDSGSSSSDSPSGSSPESECDGAKVSFPPKHFKDIEGSGTTLEQEKSDLSDPHDGNRSTSGLDQVEQNAQPKSVSAEVDGHQEGENASSGRRVSPEKLYRAALLKNRFADTILKAREKTLDQGETRDPEKLRREREELEKRQREEKARLQAEAKAAEDARKRANAEAAAEAKRKRELDRAAARQALQKMEKTVEINGNYQFLKDLEMLSSAPMEHLPNLDDETSPGYSQDVMGSFKLPGSNPLEQLGLYMKVDDEEEECELANVSLSAPSNDIEDGEID